MPVATATVPPRSSGRPYAVHPHAQRSHVVDYRYRCDVRGTIAGKPKRATRVARGSRPTRLSRTCASVQNRYESPAPAPISKVLDAETLRLAGAELIA